MYLITQLLDATLIISLVFKLFNLSVCFFIASYKQI